jgi:hypothetical protein
MYAGERTATCGRPRLIFSAWRLAIASGVHRVSNLNLTLVQDVLEIAVDSTSFHVMKRPEASFVA